MMRLRVGNPRDFCAGLIFTGIGGFVLTQIGGYDIGTAGRMGPGYFPLVIAILMIAVGLLAAARALAASGGGSMGIWPLVPLVFLTLGVVAFALLIERAGLIAADVVLTSLICYRRWRTHPLQVAGIVLGITGFTVLLFVYGLNLPLSLY